MTKHSLISPSNFERRMLCAGSLNAEKDLPNTTSKHAEEGTMLHERTASYLKACVKWGKGLNESQKNAVKNAGDYFNNLKDKGNIKILGEFHERKYSLSFIHDDMRGTADSVLLLENTETQIVEVHVIDYKFGKGVPVKAYGNYQLLLYYFGVTNDLEIKKLLKGKCTTMHLHIVQPFIKNSRWDLTEEDRLEFCKKSFYKNVVEACYDLNAIRTASKKACVFCKAKPTCPAIAKTIPKINTDIFNLEDSEIAAIYDNKDLIKSYLASIEEYIKNKLSNDSFEGYELKDKLSNRKWNKKASHSLQTLLGDESYELTKKLITIGKAEKLLDKEIINELTMKEVNGVEIIKI